VKRSVEKNEIYILYFLLIYCTHLGLKLQKVLINLQLVCLDLYLTFNELCTENFICLELFGVKGQSVLNSLQHQVDNNIKSNLTHIFFITIQVCLAFYSQATPLVNG